MVGLLTLESDWDFQIRVFRKLSRSRCLKACQGTLMELLSHHLYERYMYYQEDISDLEEAISIKRTLLERRPPGHPGRIYVLIDLATCLETRFYRLGMLSNLDEALDLQRKILPLHRGNDTRPSILPQMANCLHARFNRLGMLADINEAISLARNILELCGPWDSNRPTSLSNLAGSLHVRFQHLGQLPDLDEAISLETESLALTRRLGNDRHAASLGNTGSYLYTRFLQLGMVFDLEDALYYTRESLKLHPPGHLCRPITLIVVAQELFARFKHLGELSDLDEAISLAREASELRPQVLYLGNLARFLYARFKSPAMHDSVDLDEIFNIYSRFADLTQLEYSMDSQYQFIKDWINIAEEHSHSTTVPAYQTFLRLSVHHLATLPSLPQHLPIVKRYMASTAVDAFSACVRHKRLTDAVELLEQGRGVFWSQLNRLRSQLDDVIASGDRGRELADKFMDLSALLRKTLDSPSNAESRHDRAWSLSVKLQDTIADIRKLPGLSLFLRSLFSDLQNAAACGLVIIVNCSQYSCDALIILHDKDPIHVSLRVTKSRVSELSSRVYSLTLRAKTSDVSKELLALLREIWVEIVAPITTVLREFCSRGSRIWWCPTAEFSLLPLHAAGPFRKGQQGLPDLYVSSYTPTLAALIRARREGLSESIERHRLLLVGQAQAPEQCELALVGTELSCVSQCTKSVTTLTCVEGRDATITNVAKEFNKNEFVHFACHGIPSPKQPFESGFALGDGLLKVEHIMGYDLQNAKFAYLSACHTTVGDEESPDEVIHLAAAMQFAGFRSVIGTMWAVDDAHTNAITSRFYAEMLGDDGRLDHTRAALALHRTMRRIRSSDVPIDQQILYVHIGA